ncbi:hypothetical protein DFH94DRAFT_686968 [Russula ochroleuca]|uniref:Uncharacterized protein n=1 Tax=Russula ochroleuca TaxID=152965 RepID=A0A9P5JUQ5_9AGAM|nr:hypothetical protein DFH94DRAFT_686968 [Russula ochroleuca]
MNPPIILNLMPTLAPLTGLNSQFPEILPLSALFPDPFGTLINAAAVLAAQSTSTSPTPISSASDLSFEEISPPPLPINYDWVALNLELVGVHVLPPSPVPPLPRPLSLLPPIEEAQVENQENIPPKFCFPEPCAARHLAHPHQFHAVYTACRTKNRPLCEVSVNNLLSIPTVAYLAETPCAFPSVTPFRVFVPHHIHIKPTVPELAQQLIENTPTACGRAICYAPSPAIPLGFVRYTFTFAIKNLFREAPNEIRELFIGFLVILNIHDFLDGRQVTTYSYLAFSAEGGIYCIDQGYHCEDVVRVAPFLLSHTLTPCIPADPLDHIVIMPSTLPL